MQRRKVTEKVVRDIYIFGYLLVTFSELWIQANWIYQSTIRVLHTQKGFGLIQSFRLNLIIIHYKWPIHCLIPIKLLCESLIVKAYLKPIIGDDCKHNGFMGTRQMLTSVSNY